MSTTTRLTTEFTLESRPLLLRIVGMHYGRFSLILAKVWQKNIPVYMFTPYVNKTEKVRL